MKNNLQGLVGIVTLLMLLVCKAAPASEQAIRQAEALVNAGQHQQAKELLITLERGYLGDPRYDYLLGLVLIETGEAGKAVFALQRAIASAPEFAGARLDLARAYFATGDLNAAKQELEQLRDENPPPAASKAIDEYLSLIANRQRRLRMEFHLGTRLGYDSNANSATNANSFLGFDLLEQSRETASPFAELTGRVILLKPISAKLLLDTRLGLSQRNNPDASFVNAGSGNISLGIRRVSEGSSQSLRLQSYRTDVDGRLNSEGFSLAGNWDYSVRRNLRIGILGQIGRTTFGESLRIKDVDNYLFGVKSEWTFGVSGRGSMGGSLLAGTDDPRRTGSRYARDLSGIRFNAGWAFSPQFTAQFTAGLMRSDYDEIFFEQQFDTPREDTLTQLSVKLKWRISPGWLMSHVVAYTNNDTDVDVFRFERIETGLSLHRIWR